MAAKVGAVIVAAGSSTRMGGEDKIFAPVLGRPLLAWVTEPFEHCAAVHKIVLVLSQANLERGRRLVSEASRSKVTQVCLGGPRRQDSVKAGLSHLQGCDWVLVHDGARPAVDQSLIEKGLAEARATGAAIPAVPVKDTVKVVGPDGLVSGTPPRHELWAVQTPQVFRYELLLRAYEQADAEATDDATLVERLGHKIKVFMGSYTNIKVTTPEDLALVRFLLRSRNRREMGQVPG